MNAGCRTLKLPALCWLLPIALTTAGCAPRSPKDGDGPSAAVVVKNEPVESVGVPSTASSQSQTVSASESSLDLGGRAVEQAVAPDTPALPPIRETSRVERSLAVASGSFHADVTRKPTLPPVLPKQVDGMRPIAPVERLPSDLGLGTRSLPARPTLPIKAVVTKRARDVNLPPPLPLLGRQATDRVSLDDPTTELANAAIVEPRVKVPFTPAAFVKVGIPDPFELSEQIKPATNPSSGPGLTLVPVNPRRVK
jgi:hypothetical protein